MVRAGPWAFPRQKLVKSPTWQRECAKQPRAEEQVVTAWKLKTVHQEKYTGKEASTILRV